MSEPLADFIPGPSPAPRASRRGGPRPGSGPPVGNLNAFKHGRYSRFKDALPPAQPVAAGAARRLVTREQRIAERHAANLLALAALLDGATEGNNPEINHPTTPSPEPTPRKQPTDPDSLSASRKRTTSTNRRPRPQPAAQPHPSQTDAAPPNTEGTASP